MNSVEMQRGDSWDQRRRRDGHRPKSYLFYYFSFSRFVLRASKFSDAVHFFESFRSLVCVLLVRRLSNYRCADRRWCRWHEAEAFRDAV